MHESFKDPSKSKSYFPFPNVLCKYLPSYIAGGSGNIKNKRISQSVGLRELPRTVTMDAALLSLTKMIEVAITSHREDRVRGLLTALRERSGQEQSLVLNHSELGSYTTNLGNKAVVFDHHGLTLLQREFMNIKITKDLCFEIVFDPTQ